MRKCVAIGGVPGTGKTTLMRKYINILPPVKEFRKLVKGHEWEEYIILGDYSDEAEVFAGTDKFSMAVQPEAAEFFKENEKHVIFEGDRIFNGKMLDTIQSLGYDLLIVILESDANVLKKRYSDRGSDQSDKFLTGRATKYDNIKNDGNFSVYTAKHETPEDTDAIVTAIAEFIFEDKIDTNVLTLNKMDSLDDFFN